MRATRNHVARRASSGVTFSGDVLATRCVFLPLSSYADVPRAKRTEVFGWVDRPDERAVVPWSGRTPQVTGSLAEKVECVEIADLVVQDAADWVVSGFLIDGVLRHTDPCVVEVFATRLRQGAEARQPIVVSRYGQVGLAGVMYVGQRASAKFLGCALGHVVSRSIPAGDGPRVTIPVDSEGLRGRHATTLAITCPVRGAPILVRSLDIQDPHDWIINDLWIDGRSQLLYPGDLPSEALRAPERLNMCLDIACREVKILVTYDGEQELGSELRGAIVGWALDN